MQGIRTADEFLSKILSIFKTNLADLSLTPIDKLVSILREISCRIFLIFDNLDELLSSESSPVRLAGLFGQLLDSNVNVNVVFTTREILENMRDLIECFRDIRIRPLHPLSSVEFVRQLLPSFSESVVANVARISSHVPLAMKLVASIVENNNEDMANKILGELSLKGNLLEIDRSYEQNMRRLFETPFEQLTLADKHALISLTVFSSCRISKDAAVDVISDEIGVVRAVGSLKTLVKKSLIDEDPYGEYYSIHPLIYSFVLDKAKQLDFENVLNSSRLRFSTYYLLLFERLYDDFLAGKSIEGFQLQDTMQSLSLAIDQSITSSLENSQNLFRILSKSEIFLLLLGLPFRASLGNGFPFAASPNIGCPGKSLDCSKLYDLAMEKCRTQKFNYPYSKLYVSKYFESIAFSFFSGESEYSDTSENLREHVMLLSDGSAAKLGCYEGISLIVNGNVESGIERIEKHLDNLQRYPDQQLVKCLCLQLLSLFHTEYSKSSNFSRKAIEVCKEIGNYNLFLIADCKQSLSPAQNECKGEQLILFVYLLFFWSKRILGDETKLHFLSIVQKIEQQIENKPLGPHYLFPLVTYGDCLLAFLGFIAGQEALLDEKIRILDKAPNSELTDKTFRNMSANYRLFNCYALKMFRDIPKNATGSKEQNLSGVDTSRKALDHSIKHFGKQHGNTAFCYLEVGMAENAAENYISALDAFNQALEIMRANPEESNSNSNSNISADAYVGKGKTCISLYKYESAFVYFEEALKIKRKHHNEDSEEIAHIFLLLGISKLNSSDPSSALYGGGNPG